MTKTLALLIAMTGCVLYTQEASAWTVSQTFDDKSVGTSCGWEAAGGSKIDSGNAYSGSKSCRLSVTAGDTAFGNWGGIINHPSRVGRGGEIWVRIRTFMPVGFNYNSNGEGNHLKFFRIHTMSDSNENFGYNDIYINPKGSSVPFQFIYEGEQVWSMIGSLAGLLLDPLLGTNKHPIQLGTWETYEFYVKLDTASAANGGQGLVRFWKNGVLMKEIRDRQTLRSADGYSDRTHLFTYWNGGAPATQSMYVDDVVVTTDRPGAKDAAGNAYVGVGVPNPAKSPSPPAGVTAQ